MDVYRTYYWCVTTIRLLVGTAPRTGVLENVFSAGHAVGPADSSAYRKGEIDAFRYLTGFFHHTDPLVLEVMRTRDLTALVVEVLKQPSAIRQEIRQDVADALYLLISA